MQDACTRSPTLSPIRYLRDLRIPIAAVSALGLWLLLGESLRLLSLPAEDFWMTQLTVGVVLAGLAAAWVGQAAGIWQSVLRLCVLVLMQAQVYLVLWSLMAAV